MKKLLLLIVAVFFLGCKSQKNISKENPKNRTYETDYYSFEYPKSWVHFKAHNYEDFTPKRVKYNGFSRKKLINISAVFTNENKEGKTLKQIVEGRINKHSKFYDEILLKEKESRFGKLFKIECVKNETEIIKGGSKSEYKIFLKDNIIYEFLYSSVNPIYKRYYNESRMIFDTFKLKD